MNDANKHLEGTLRSMHTVLRAHRQLPPGLDPQTEKFDLGVLDALGTDRRDRTLDYRILRFVRGQGDMKSTNLAALGATRRLLYQEDHVTIVLGPTLRQCDEIVGLMNVCPQPPLKNKGHLVKNPSHVNALAGIHVGHATVLVDEAHGVPWFMLMAISECALFSANRDPMMAMMFSCNRLHTGGPAFERALRPEPQEPAKDALPGMEGP